jgi:hypothetical protein
MLPICQGEATVLLGIADVLRATVGATVETHDHRPDGRADDRLVRISVSKRAYGEVTTAGSILA